MAAEYDRIGRTYAVHRRADPRIAAQLGFALGGARSVVNVGAGSGSYEPDDGRWVVAVEPSSTMRAQRRPGTAPCIAGVAGALPFADRSFEAALAVLTLHHWPDQRTGLEELRRVAGRQVILTFDPAVHEAFWMVDEYLPEVAALPGSGPLAPADIAEVLGGRVEVVPVPADCTDGFFWANWRRPQAYLDPVVRAGISALAQLPAPVVDRAMERLSHDLSSGAWHDRHADLLDLDEIDGGYRLVVAGPNGR